VDKIVFTNEEYDESVCESSCTSEYGVLIPNFMIYDIISKCVDDALQRTITKVGTKASAKATTAVGGAKGIGKIIPIIGHMIGFGVTISAEAIVAKFAEKSWIEKFNNQLDEMAENTKNSLEEAFKDYAKLRQEHYYTVISEGGCFRIF